MVKGMKIQKADAKITKFEVEYKDYKLHIYVEETNDSFESFFSVDEYAYTLCLVGVKKVHPNGHRTTKGEFMELFDNALDRIDERLEFYFEDIAFIEQINDLETEEIE